MPPPSPGSGGPPAARGDGLRTGSALGPSPPASSVSTLPPLLRPWLSPSPSPASSVGRGGGARGAQEGRCDAGPRPSGTT
eukprot:10242046-Alexandrium_andersonii.AAC.1